MNTIHGSVTGRKPDAESPAARSAPSARDPSLVDPAELIPADEAARILRQKPQTLAMWRSKHRGPVWVKIGRSVYYTPAGLREYVTSCLVVPSPKVAK